MTSLAFEMRRVCQSYPHFQLDNINLSLHTGTIHGLIGPNGAGKSTIIRSLMGLLIPDAGEIEVLGIPVNKQARLAKWDVGYASEDMRLYKNMSLQWHMDLMKSIYPSWDEHYASLLLKRFDLIPQQKIKGMSHGQSVKAKLLLVFARRPKLLLLDEPTTGLDPVARQEVLKELMDVMLDEQRSILFSSHNTQDIEQLSDYITFIDRGQVISSDDKDNFMQAWRRVRLLVPNHIELPLISDWHDIRRSGQIAVANCRHFDPAVESQFSQLGIKIESIETLTLEEIFVAEVFASRQGESR